MKKLLIVLMLVVPSLSANPIDEIINDFKMSNVYAADWYEKGDSKIAESSNQYRDIKVNLSHNKGSLKVILPIDKYFDIYALMPCYRLTKYIDYPISDNWSDPDTKEELIIKSVFNDNIKNGETKSAILNGWNIEMTRFTDGISCEVVQLSK